VIDKLSGNFATSRYDIDYNGAPDNRAQVTKQIELEIADKLQQADTSK